MASALTTLLGSDHDGEVLAAARAAERLREALGLSCTNPPVDAPQRPETPSRDGDDPLAGRDWRLVAAACARHRAMLNDWEGRFVSNLHSFPRLSQKQRAHLAAIVRRLRALGCVV
jgi:hypothetical protein